MLDILRNTKIGSSLNLSNDWTAFSVPAYVNIPCIQGILNRAELVWHAENGKPRIRYEGNISNGIDM